MSTPKTFFNAAMNSIAQTKTIAHVASKLTAKEVTKESVSEVATKFSTTFYNKFANKDKIYCRDFAPDGAEKFADDENIYVDIAEAQPDDYDYVKIGDHAYEDMKSFSVESASGRFREISIGKNAYLYINVWKVVNGVLKVAVPYLYAGMDPSTGICKVETAGGLTYDVQVADPVEGKLSIKSAVVTPKEGYASDCVVTGNVIDATLGHYSQALAVTLNDGSADITDPSTVIYRIDAYGNMGFTVPETISGVSCTYAKYLFPWANEAVSEEAKAHTSVTLMVPAKGVISFEINAKAVVAEGSEE